MNEQVAIHSLGVASDVHDKKTFCNAVQVLIFSQFKIMLDVLEDYLRLMGFPLERIDGSVSQRDRESAIDRYSAGLRYACIAQTASLLTTILLPVSVIN